MLDRRWWAVVQWIAAAAFVCSISVPETARALPCRPGMLPPAAAASSCLNCHQTALGGGGCDNCDFGETQPCTCSSGSGCFCDGVADAAACNNAACLPNASASCCLNAFGFAWRNNGRIWNQALALLDTDGDGWTNGQELGDPFGQCVCDTDDFCATVPTACANCPSDFTGLQTLPGNFFSEPPAQNICLTPPTRTDCTASGSGGTCADGTDDNYTCGCACGYSGNGRTNVLPGGTGCSNVNQCTAVPGRCGNGACQDLVPLFQCNCNSGYQQSGDACAGTLTCVDTNECANAFTCNAIFGNGTCTNSPAGTYTCNCNCGYSAPATGGTCNPVTDCTPGRCGIGTCNELGAGAYSCTCPAGTVSAGSACAGTLTCNVTDACVANIDDCVGIATCNPTGGSTFTCTCPAGYNGNGRASGTGCNDNNECMMGTPCGVGLGMCNNLPGTYSCACNPGYTAPATGGTCTNVNECTMGTPCGVGLGMCNDLPGTYSCGCNCGYSAPATGGTCTNVNECTAMPGRCGLGACNDTVGAFTCNCPAGTASSGTACAGTLTCNVTDACVAGIDDCVALAACNPTGGSTFTCTCPAGYSGNGRASGTGCTNINECTMGTPCGAGLGMCNDLPGTYSCGCNCGYTAPATGGTCTNVNECTAMPGRCGLGTCNDTVGAFTCGCPMGTTLQGTACAGTLTCAVTDACGAGVGDCVALATCISTGGMTFMCQCPPGYSGDGRMSGTGCANVNECTMGTPCGAGLGMCNDLPGTYSCNCNAGYSAPATGGTCTDNNECTAGTPCGVGRGTCTNLPGTYSCACNCGYMGPPTGGTCNDVNECTAGRCGLGMCANTTGAYTCACPAGTMTAGTACPGTTLTCNVTDACVAGVDDCVALATCNPTGGSTFTCSCPAGYAGNGRTSGTGCTDVNECMMGTPCGAGLGSCANMPGTYACTCNAGYTAPATGGTCTNVNECTMGTPCGAGLGTCMDLPGTYSCGCNCGYSAPATGGTCTNVNECMAMPTRCGLGTCNDTTGAFTCTCPAGTAVTGAACPGGTLTCGVTDACVAGIDDCVALATCNPTGGSSFTCSCPAGYSGNGRTSGTGCTDINECTAGTPCGAGLGSCANMPGTYACTCNCGYSAPATGGTCTNVNECTAMPTRCGLGTCNDTTGGFTCTCVTGANTQGTACPGGTLTCVDTDECAGNPCGPGTCSQLNPVPPGGYDCACNPGYSFDGTTCTDIDECASSIDNCDNDPVESTCVNTIGGFTCTCNTGWTGGPNDGVTCDNVDECAAGTAVLCDFDGTDPTNADYASLAYCNTPPLSGPPCAASCMDTPGGYACACNAGWNGDGMSCRDVNDCGAMPCQPIIETCVNEVGLPRTCACQLFAQQMDGTCRIVCGDGHRAPGEQCDDGNPIAGDGCNDLCRIEPRWACSEDATLLSTCSMTCGDGFVDPLEDCDDGAGNSDTAPDACRTTCDAAGCGDGVTDTGEQCDAGASNSDTVPGACRTSCTQAMCGDGVVDPGEICDPGGGAARPATDCTIRCGADGGLDGSVDPTDPPVLTGGGCGCTTAGAPTSSGLGVGFAAFALALLLRRRRPKHHPT